MIIGTVVRLDRNPGGTPEWMGNVIVAIFVAAVMCLTLVYLLSYIHLSAAKRSIFLSACLLFGVSVAVVLLGIVPPFTKDTSRTINVVHIVDKARSFDGKQDPRSYVSLFSYTPGKLTKEVEQINEGFICGRDKGVDLVTFSVKYGCWNYDETDGGWSESDVPAMHVDTDTHGNKRMTQVLIDTKGSVRWSLAINADEIEDFTFKDVGSLDELVLVGDMSSVDGWHIIQFSGGKNAPTRFGLTLFWAQNATQSIEKKHASLLKLRTDKDIVTPKVERVLSKLPPWCSLFGKSTSPLTFAFLSNLPVNF